MERIHLDTDGLDTCVTRAVSVVKSGGVVLFPTDTLYGLGADAFSNAAVDHIFDIKGRHDKKPLHALVTDLDMAFEYGVIDDLTRMLVKELPKGKLTFVVAKKEGLDTGVGRGLTTFGFRIPDNEFCQSFVRTFGKPVTATSANRSGIAPERSVDGILAQFGPDADALGLVVDGGELPLSEPSTVVDMTGHHPVILREGAVPAADVWSAIKSEH